MTGGPKDICIYKCMFLARVRLPFSLIIREMLSFWGVASGQLMPNGCRYFLAMLLLWLSMFPGKTMSVSKFLNIYGLQIYPNIEKVTFMVHGKNQFIEVGKTYSNNKHWAKQFFYVSGAWKVSTLETLPLKHIVLHKWGTFRESCE